MTLPQDEQDLPHLSEELEQRLALALRSAWAPAELDPQRHEQLLEAALEDPFAAPSAEELAESERFRQALEGGGEHPHLPLARALQAAHKAQPLSELSAHRIARQSQKTRSGAVYWGSLGLTAALAAAALFALWAPSSERTAAEPMLQDLAQSRSTAPLFADASAVTASARIDRIAEVRTRELRDNRYAAWGVR
jgi:hypothetical protein